MEKESEILEKLRNLEILVKETEKYISSDMWHYADRLNNYISQINKIINNLKNLNVDGFAQEPLFEFYDWDFSASGKTIKDEGLNRLKDRLEKYLELIQITEEKIRSPKIEIKDHEIRRCFKLGFQGCPKKPILNKSQFFVGMPYNPKYKDSYEYGIKIILETYGYNPYLAEDEKINIDIMCKICFKIQESFAAIFNLSGFNPNVMMELGLAYGIGKKVIILLDEETPEITNLKNIECLRYSNAVEIQRKLPKYIENI